MSTVSNVSHDPEYSSSIETNTAQIIRKQQRQKAKADFIQSLLMWKIWLALAWQDIRIRYRRSIIGPLWITLSMAITVYSMGFLYARLFHLDLYHYFPFLVSGMLGWTLIQSLISEGVDAYLFAGSLIRQVKLPYFFHIHRLCARNFIISAHNVLVIVPIYLFFYHQASVFYLLPVFALGLLIIYFNAVLVVNLLAIVCSRYRDMGQVIKSLLQVLFFLTPVMWDPVTLDSKYKVFIVLNPLYDFIELIRQPMLGYFPSFSIYMMVLIYTSFGLVLNYFMFVRYRSRIVYWL